MAVEAFTAAGYRDLLTKLLGLGYRVRGYDDVNPAAPDLILRHDVDMSLQAAVDLAEIEHAMGIAAHYFVLLRTEMYNPHSAIGQAAVRRLVALGHRVGLHLDASLYSDDAEALEVAAQVECGILERISDALVEVVSFHRPARSLLGSAIRPGGRRSTYEPAFVSDISYCSDSRGGWHHGHPLDHPAVAAGRALQLLTHPIWWTGDARVPVQERLERFAAERLRLLREELERNCGAYDSSVPLATQSH